MWQIFDFGMALVKVVTIFKLMTMLQGSFGARRSHIYRRRSWAQYGSSGFEAYFFSLGPPLAFLPLPTSPQTRMAGHSSRVSTITLASVVSPSSASMPARIIGCSSTVGPSSAAAPITVELVVGRSCGAGVALVQLSSTSLVSASSKILRLFATVVLTGSLSDGSNNAGASDTASLFCQVAVAGCQHGEARRELAFVWSELYQFWF